MAMMFQRAPPEVAGFGSITSTSGLARSSKLVMCFGLPGRTIRVTTESVTIPLYWFWSQSAETMPASTRRCMSGSSENSTTSAGWPDSTARLWSPDAPNELEKSTSLPSDVSLKPGSRLCS